MQNNDPTRILPVVLGSVVAATAALPALAWYLTVELEAQGADLPPVVVVVLCLIALSLLIQAPAIERLIGRKAAQQSEPQAGSTRAIGSIIGFAMREGCGVIGLVLAVLRDDWRFSAVASAAAIVAMVAAWPKKRSDQGLHP